jgi:hypothetical protein
VTDYISVLQVFIAGAPTPVANAQYDLETSYLWTYFVNGTAEFFVGVPRGQATQNPLQWSALKTNREALVQAGPTWCPILTSAGTPLLTR